jgi:hypothetical protein
MSARIAAAAHRLASGGIPAAPTRNPRLKVISVKKRINPARTPAALPLPPAALWARIIGRRGNTQGEKAVASPAAKAKGMRMPIF